MSSTLATLQLRNGLDVDVIDRCSPMPDLRFVREESEIDWD